MNPEEAALKKQPLFSPPNAMFTADELLKKVNQHIATLPTLERKPQGLYSPVKYVLAPGGKRLRPVLMLMAYNLLRDDVDSILNLAAGIEIFHNYTLLHDDVMDHADLRRGKPTVHQLWDVNTAILSGDAMYALASELMAQCPPETMPAVLQLFHRTSLEICEGQQLDMEFENRQDVSEDEYIEMIRLKTSVLLATSLKIGAITAGANTQLADALYHFGIYLGIAFQLQDDLLDVYGNTAVFGKKIGGDIRCNKKTFLLIQALALANPSQRKQLSHWLNQTDNDTDEKVKAVTNIYNEIGIKHLAESRIDAFTSQAQQDLDQVDAPNERKTALREMMRELTHRQS